MNTENTDKTSSEAQSQPSCLAVVSGSAIIDYLKTLPENSGQMVDLKMPDKTKRFYFMWFLSDEKLDLKPIDNICLFTVHKKYWHQIELVF